MKRDYYLIVFILCGLLVVVAARPWVSTTSVRLGETLSQETQTRPLRFLMVGLGQEMSRINDGLWHEDYEMIAAGATGVAEHPRIAAEEMTAIKNALGDRFESFVGFDKSVHLNATELAIAAGQRKMQKILEAHDRLQRGCISCHATFRDEVRKALY